MLNAAWFLATYKSELDQYKNIWLAYSGGIDSHVLLDVARHSLPQIRAVHINHDLSAVDNALQQHCKTICTSLNIPLECITVNAAVAGLSPEAAARAARRAAWEKLLGPDDLLLVAHHAQDQAETILFRLLRGSGPQGLRGIRVRSKVGAADLLRPLLDIAKTDINAYALQHKLNYYTDPSNSQNAFDRNFLRNNILPQLNTRWPAAVANINRAAALCSELEQCLDPLIATKLETLQDTNLVLNLRGLQQQPELWQRAILRAWLQQYAIVPSQKQLNLIMQQVLQARRDASPEYILGGKIIKRARQSLYVLNQVVMTAATYVIPWNLQEELLLPNGSRITVANLAAQPEFVSKLARSQVTVRLGAHGRKAKKVFQQYAIPPWQRGEYPLVFADNRLVAIVGLWNSRRF